MNSTVINIKSCSADEIDISELESLILNEFSQENATVTTMKSFNGMSDIIIILSIGGGVAIKQAANIIIHWINNNEKKKIKYKGVEMSGYSAKEVKELLSEVNSDD